MTNNLLFTDEVAPILRGEPSITERQRADLWNAYYHKTATELAQYLQPLPLPDDLRQALLHKKEHTLYSDECVLSERRATLKSKNAELQRAKVWSSIQGVVLVIAGLACAVIGVWLANAVGMGFFYEHRGWVMLALLFGFGGAWGSGLDTLAAQPYKNGRYVPNNRRWQGYALMTLGALIAITEVGWISGVIIYRNHPQTFYSLVYSIPADRVTLAPVTHECNFYTAPVGAKYCHHERVVTFTRADDGVVTSVVLDWRKIED